MKSGKVMLKVLNPRGKGIPSDRVSKTAPLKDLRGKKIAILNNNKSGGNLLLPYIEESLKSAVPGVQLKAWKVPFAASAAEKETAIRQMADYADAVIALIGD